MKGSIILMTLVLFSCKADHAEVTIRTDLGHIVVELYPGKAPVTVDNFLDHCRKGTFDGAVFYRVVNLMNQPLNDVKIEVIQGGLFADSLIELQPAIVHESTGLTGIHHKDGTLSMARLEPGTASTEFFICVGDQPSLDFGGKRNPDGQGFAAFGKVVSGMEVVHAIHALPAPEQYIEQPVLIHEVTITNNL